MKNYETYNKYLLRKPLFSKDILFDNDETKDIEEVVHELVKNDFFVSSIYWSSPDLYKTIISFRNNTLKEDRIPKLIHTLKKYAIRSSTRCTPYGTMAGVALKSIKDATEPESKSLLRKARVDMDFLTAIKIHIEGNLNIKRHLKYKVNNTFAKIPRQFRYQEPVGNESEGKSQLSSIEINEYLEKISDLKDFTSYSEISALFSSDFNDDEITQFIDELIDIKFLVSELQLTLTSNNLDHLKSVLDKLSNQGIAEVRSYIEILEKIEHCISKIEETCVSYLPIAEIAEIKDLVQPLGIEKIHLFHVDMLHSSESNYELTEKTLRNISTSVAILHKLAGDKVENSDLHFFKKIFNTRYESREVPLSQILDTEFGIGFPATNQIGELQGNALIEGLAKEKNSSKKNSDLSHLDFLLNLIEQGDKDIVQLESIDLKFEQNPIAAQNFCVIGSTYQHDFFLQSVATSGANSILGRFALSDDKINSLCQEIQTKEKNSQPEIIFAEIIYIPEKRTANIARRPKFSEYEIPIFANGNTDQEKQILLKDIMVSVERDEIILKSIKFGKRIIPTLSNAHNYHKSESAAYKFLCSVQSQNQKNFNLNIDYAKTKKRFFPRIVYRNIILHRACWLMYETDIQLIKNSKDPILQLKNFLQKWKVSKYIVLVQGDNELFLDIENESYLSLLIDELKSNVKIQLSECLSQINGEKGYSEQIVLPLENHEFKKLSSFSKDHSPSIQRSFAPGSEWLYLKIYCNSNFSDTLLSTIIRPILDDLIKEDLIKSAFFIRYTDPNYHIRLRFNLKDNAKYGEVLQKIHQELDPYFQEETIWNLQIDSYQRELERYSPEYMKDTEIAFYYDSVMILNLLSDEEFVDSEEVRLFSAVRNVDAWLNVFDLSLQEKLDFCKAIENGFLAEFSTDYKSHIYQKYRLLNGALGNFFDDQIFQKEFEDRHQHFKNLKLCKTYLSSYIHMSINRWFSAEQRALELMTYSFAVKYYSRIISQSK
ncbi:hypothetical protein FNJ88_08405 [Chryseobacterium sp. SNU WT5]|uniref:lantibiotic dehydratase n=1 Tax=Chryseobacterium sp. SNU WT5 TaxID=2594269 RepID=UPI0011800D06|nr:lantibiotic dehydratase [Chryseobacterium sp. SNU WT5]QDP85582.1 hypothetical protein FNJ88_08405 [Chryseobacterium sp. SNU WT5]